MKELEEYGGGLEADVGRRRGREGGGGVLILAR